MQRERTVSERASRLEENIPKLTEFCSQTNWTAHTLKIYRVSGFCVDK